MELTVSVSFRFAVTSPVILSSILSAEPPKSIGSVMTSAILSSGGSEMANGITKGRVVLNSGRKLGRVARAEMTRDLGEVAVRKEYSRRLTRAERLSGRPGDGRPGRRGTVGGVRVNNISLTVHSCRKKG